METRELTLADLLKRVDLNGSLTETVQITLLDYDLGQLVSIEPLLVGHEELNVVVTTTEGKFVFKFLNKRKSRRIAKSSITALKKLEQAHLPVPSLVPTKQGKGLYVLHGQRRLGKGFMYVTEHFEGRTFNETAPTEQDMAELTGILAEMHKLNFRTKPEYDFWLLVYLVDEFDKRKHYLSKNDISLVKPIVDEIRQVDFSRLGKGVVHYDLHRDNVRKGPNGDYCLFDFATVEHGYPVIDLATYIGLFCLSTDNALTKNRELFHFVINEYQSQNPLSQYEKQHLFTFVKGIYASNVVAANYLYVEEEDNTDENMKWYELGKWGLQTFQQVSL